MKRLIILLVILGFMTSCEKEEPVVLPTYNQIKEPPTNDIPIFVGSTWVIYKFQTLNLSTPPEFVTDTLKFINITELTYNGVPCEYEFYPSGYLWYFEIKQTPRFIGNINSFINREPINYGNIHQQEFVNVYIRNQKWLVWMKKVN